MRKLRFLLTLIHIAITLGVYSQINTGGNIGVNLQNNIFQFDFAPEINYNPIHNFSLGASPFILYSKNLQTNMKLYIYGARVYAEYIIIQGFFVHCEYEYSRAWTNEGFGMPIHAIPLGGGFEQEIAPGMVAYGMILYDVLYSYGTSIRQNPIVRAGVRYTL